MRSDNDEAPGFFEDQNRAASSYLLTAVSKVMRMFPSGEHLVILRYFLSESSQFIFFARRLCVMLHRCTRPYSLGSQSE